MSIRSPVPSRVILIHSYKPGEHLASLPFDETNHDQFFIKLGGSDRPPIQSFMDSGNYQEGCCQLIVCAVSLVDQFDLDPFWTSVLISPMDVVM